MSTFPQFGQTLGDWRAVAALGPSDPNNSFKSSNVSSVDCKDTILLSTANRVHLTSLGLDNIVAVATEDAVLVAASDRLQNVRKVVDLLKLNGVSQATQHARDYQPWGWFESLALLPNYQIKCLHINPGAMLSLQSHKYRSEHWIVVDGTASVWRDDELFPIGTNLSIYIEAGQIHRLANETEYPQTVIEVQTGSYFGEGDIIRYEDVYRRKN